VSDDRWIEANRRHLIAAIGAVRETLASGPASAERAAALAAVDAAGGFTPRPALDRLTDAFGLSPFERDVVVLAAGVELDPEVRGAVDAAGATGLTLGLAMAALPGAHWTALTPIAPLRRYRLIELDGATSLAQARVRIDERVLHFLVGVPAFDARLTGLIDPVPTVGHADVVATHLPLVKRMVSTWSRHRTTMHVPVIQLCGPDAPGKLPPIAAACQELGLALHVVRAVDLPTPPAERDAFTRLWEREAMLASSVLVVDCDDTDGVDVQRTVSAFAERAAGLIVVTAREPIRLRRRMAVRLDVPRPTAGEQTALWGDMLAGVVGDDAGELGNVVSQFSLSAPAIRSAGAEVLERIVDGDDTPVLRMVWETCRTQSRPKLDDLAQRIDASASWADIVLPDEQLDFLRDIVAHVRQRAQVYEGWGFAERGNRGLGITALFAGVSGTGKTMAAEVVAGALGLDLYRIDLSQVVSKYIGETEKNLRRIFDSAEEGGAVLLFDEADALFGKRSEIKDSHDRYANLEISYLLQRMEQYRGLAILTTNMRNALDTAFLRRLRFVIEFPFPGTEQRAEIWRRVFPAATPTEQLDIRRLAKLNIAGGAIRNIALNAAFLAADETTAVRMRHIAQAARIEFAKLERPVSEAELGAWT
jgi:hypothetical protein